ncbi:MAG: VWA domain-containing protein, partial [Chloroflexi bacterium]|nr:VWA domain-containing protein [Chloroflexota bacterium]
EAVGIHDRETFRAALRTTLVKDSKDQATFDQYFPLFFGSMTPPPMHDIMQNMSPEQQQQMQQAMQQALQALAGNMDALRQLMQQLMNGQPFSQDQLDQMGQQAGMDQATDLSQQPRFERRMQRQMSMQQMQQAIEELLEQLRAQGMSNQELRELREMLEENAAALSEQVSDYVGVSLAERMADSEPRPQPDLMDVPFNRLGQDDVDNIRDEIRRLAARLRSRASLRQRRAKVGDVDTRRVMRHNMRYDGVPFEMKYRTRHVKPCLVLICDISTSMRHSAEFLLTLIYELQDQVSKTDSFIFIDDMVDISMVFTEHEPQNAVERVLVENRPGYYNTDLGNSLNTFRQDFMDRISSRTTVIILGDGRNNYNNPRTDIAQEIERKSRRVIWFNPEPRAQWGSGDSDMLEYATCASGVYKVSNLRELAAAVDKILADG